MSDAQIVVVDQQNTQLSLDAPGEAQVNIAVPGVQGATGEGVPSGGTTNEVLFKQSGTDYDTAWGEITSAMIGDLEIVNADVAAAAAIAGTKISPNFGSQNVITTGTSTAASFIPSSSTVPTNGVYLPAANSVAISTNGTGRLFIDADGNIGINSSAPPNLGSGVVVVEAKGGTAVRGGVFRSSTSDASVRTRYGIVDSIAYLGVDTAHPLVFTTSQTERLRITADGTVNIKGAGTAGVTQAISFSGSAPVNSLVIDSSGRLGVGTASPSALIDVSGSVNPGYIAEFINTGNSANAKGLFIQAGSNNGFGNNVLASFNYGGTEAGYISHNTGTMTYAAAGGLQFNTNSQQRVTITSAGLVGIGTQSPGGELDVRSANGGAVVAGRINNTGTNSEPGYFRVRGPNASGTEKTWMDIYPIVNDATNASEDASLVFKNIKNGALTESIRVDSSGGFRVKGAGTAGVNDAVQLNGSAPANSLLLDGSGRLLVGTSSARTRYANILQTETIGSGSSYGFTTVYNGNDVFGGAIAIGKSRGTSAGSNTIVASGDTLGGIQFVGADGTDLESAARIEAFVDGTPGTNVMPGRLVFSTTADGASTPTERMRINANGAVIIDNSGTEIESASLCIDSVGLSKNGIAVRMSGSNSAFTVTSAGLSNTCTAATFKTNFGTVGSITCSSTTSYNTSSDYRLKENVTPVTDGITRLQQLKPSRFNFIADPDKTVDGFIAHEVQAVVPEAITGEKDAVDDDGNPVYQGIDQSKLVPLLTAALQEAVAKIESLEARLDAANL